jgi:indole-3-glycerol phosphate synthase
MTHEDAERFPLAMALLTALLPRGGISGGGERLGRGAPKHTTEETNMSVLDEILAGVVEDLGQRMSEAPLSELRSRVVDMPPALDPMPAFREPGVAIIAEVKRKSPSKGELADIPDPASLAGQYARGGASAISVLTERRRFGGSLADLDAVRNHVDIPVLRKDFIVDPYQLWESRAHGADLALVMVVSLSDGQLAEMLGLCDELGLTPLVESHTAEEVGRAVGAGAKLLGINARDLTTLNVDRSVSPSSHRSFPKDLYAWRSRGWRARRMSRNTTARVPTWSSSVRHWCGQVTHAPPSAVSSRSPMSRHAGHSEACKSFCRFNIEDKSEGQSK